MKILPLSRALLVLTSCCFGAMSSFAQPATLPNVTFKASEVINLWPGTAPGETGAIGPEHVLPDRPRPFDQITDVTVPTLAVCLPAPEKRTGTAMLVIPGGGLERLAIEHEGYEVAEWLNERGITAFILKYRVPPRDREQRWKVGLQDAQRAMGIIRSRASEWGVDDDALGSIGFSAGAEINVLLSVAAAGRDYPVIDAADALSARPAFNIAIYGGGFADVRANQMRPDIASRITKDTPPMFIAHAFDDQALSSIILMNALKRANVVSELHIFGAGGHGFGVRDSGLPVGHWRDLCLNWLGWQGYLDAAGVRSYAKNFVTSRNGPTPALPRFSSVNSSGGQAEAFAAQRRLVREAVSHGDEVVGYKGAYTSAAAQTVASLDHPLHGVLLKSGRIEASPATTVSLDAQRPILVETEIGYVIAVDIGSTLRVPAQALSAVEFVVPVVELPHDLGARMDGKASANDVVAVNTGSNRFIVGAPLAPKTIGNPDTLAVSLRQDGKTLHATTGADVKNGQAAHLMALINQIIDEGHVIHRGDLIICGALGGAKPGRKGAYAADFGALGSIQFKIE